jgi:hypothetical protein
MWPAYVSAIKGSRRFGAGVAGGRGTSPIIQSSPQFETANFTVAQTYHMSANFTAGSDFVFCTEHFEQSAIPLASVVVNGVTATKFQTGEGSVAVIEFWVARNLPGGADTVVVTPTSAGSGHYLLAHGLETVSIDTTVLNQVAQDHSTSTTPGSTVTTAATTQCECLDYAAWRDDTGVNNVAPATPSGWTRGARETDGINFLGGEIAYKLVQRLGTQNATFGCTSTLWYETICAINFKLPVVLNSLQKQDWVADDAWVATTAAVTIASGDVLVSVGGWWNDTGTHPVPVPTDNNGTFTATVNPDISTGENPVSVQFCHQATPTVGSHTVTPPSLATTGDGYFALVKLAGIDTSSPIRDTGRTRNWHTIHSPPDPATIQTITVTSSGSSAQVGDICLLAVVMDPNSTSNTDVAFVPPAGWWVLVNKFNCADNVGFILCAAKVTTAGQISATVTWTDANTFVADATMVVYKHL